MLLTLRAISRIAAASLGLLLLYGVVYAMEAITTRIPTTPLHELWVTTLWMAPWMLLFCSGVEDFGKVTRRAWTFWVFIIPAPFLLYYFEHHTSTNVLTKASMPILATGLGLLPHAFRRINFLYTIFSVAAGIGGLVIFYFIFAVLFSSSSFATRGTGFAFLAFGISSLSAGILSVTSFRRSKRQRTQ